MTIRWEDLNARVRGLAGRMPSADALASLSGLEDLDDLARELVSLGVLTAEPRPATAALLEQALRREAAGTLRILFLCLAARSPVLAVATDAEDRRSLRALIRGAAAGVHAEARLAGLIPTPALPERLLRELAGRSRIREQGMLLLAARHPYAQAILQAADEGEPDLFAVEIAVARVYAQRALAGARRGGGMVREYVRSVIDRENCRTALLLARGGSEGSAAQLFLEGGRLRLRTFENAAGAGDIARAAAMLGAALGGLDATLIVRHAADPAALEDAIEQEDVHRLERLSRLDPLGPAPVLHFLQRLRLQSITLARLVWSVAFRAASPSVSRAVG